MWARHLSIIKTVVKHPYDPEGVNDFCACSYEIEADLERTSLAYFSEHADAKSKLRRVLIKLEETLQVGYL